MHCYLAINEKFRRKDANVEHATAIKDNVLKLLHDSGRPHCTIILTQRILTRHPLPSTE